jgi:hypothetical protein
MAARQGEASLPSVIEIRRIERPDVGIDAAVLHVAVGAGSAHGPVHASLCTYPVSDGLVTRQAEVRCDLLVRSMATPALAGPVKRCVGLRKETGRHHLTGLCERRERRQEEHSCGERTGAEP